MDGLHSNTSYILHYIWNVTKTYIVHPTGVGPWQLTLTWSDCRQLGENLSSPLLSHLSPLSLLLSLCSQVSPQRSHHRHTAVTLLHNIFTRETQIKAKNLRLSRSLTPISHCGFWHSITTKWQTLFSSFLLPCLSLLIDLWYRPFKNSRLD